MTFHIFPVDRGGVGLFRLCWPLIALSLSACSSIRLTDENLAGAAMPQQSLQSLATWPSPSAARALPSGVATQGGAAAASGAVHDFRYQASQTMPGLHVFDDGRDTFVTVPAPTHSAPVVVVGHLMEAKVLEPSHRLHVSVQGVAQQQGQLQLVLQGVHRDFWLHWAGQAVRITYVGPAASPRDDAVKKAETASPKPDAGPDLSIQDAPAAKAPQTMGRRWDILAGDRHLAMVFERWAAAAGMKLLWDARQHFMVAAPDAFTGTFEEAVARVLSSPSIRNSKYPLEACIYKNTPPVFRVTRLGEQDCPQ